LLARAVFIERKHVRIYTSEGVLMMAPRFLVDGMLGSLSRWLRICGLETLFAGSAQDDAILEDAARDGFIVLTRDRDLHRKAQKIGLESFIVEGGSDAEMLASVAKRYGIRLDPRMSRCTACGGELRSVTKEDVVDEVPAGSYEAYDEFWRCGDCGKVYWRGSHWARIAGTISEAAELAGSPEDDLEDSL